MTKLILLMATLLLNVSLASGQNMLGTVDPGKMLLRLTPASVSTKAQVEVAEILSISSGKISRPVSSNRGGGWDPQIGGKFQLDDMIQSYVQLHIDAYSNSGCDAAGMARQLKLTLSQVQQPSDLIINVARAEQAKCVQQAIELMLAN